MKYIPRIDRRDASSDPCGVKNKYKLTGIYRWAAERTLY